VEKLREAKWSQSTSKGLNQGAKLCAEDSPFGFAQGERGRLSPQSVKPLHIKIKFLRRL